MLRIFPLYYVFLALLCLVLPHLNSDDPPNLAELHQACPWYWSYLANFYMARRGPGPFNTAHLWSLHVEEQFYLMWPAIVFLLARRNLLRLCAAAIGGAVLCRMVFMTWGASSDTICVMLPSAGGFDSDGQVVYSPEPIGSSSYRTVCSDSRRL